MDVQKSELAIASGKSGHKKVGPPGFDSNSNDLDGSFFGSKFDIDDFTRKFVNLNREASV